MMFGNGALPPAPQPAATGPASSAQQVIAGGWGYASINPASIQADNGAGLTRGIVGLDDDADYLNGWMRRLLKRFFVVPPTINYRERDPDCDLDVVANEARPTRIDCGVSTSLAFGGNDAALVMRRIA